MALESRTLYNKMIDEEGIIFDRLQTGILHLYYNNEYFEHAKKIKSLFENSGCPWDFKSKSDIKQIEPLINTDTLIGSVFTHLDSTGDVKKFCEQLQQILINKYNVTFIFNHNINKILDCTPNDIIFVCAGIGSQKLANSIGDNLEIYPVKGYSITIHTSNKDSLPKVSILDDEAKIVTSTIGNNFRVAGTAELCGENYDITRSRIEPLLKWVKEKFPDIDCSNYSQWSCLRPMTPNMMPIIKQSNKKSNIYYNTGYGHLGWTLAASTAKQIVDLYEFNNTGEIIE